MRRHTRIAAFAAVALALPAFAQNSLPFLDEYEDGGLRTSDVPPGQYGYFSDLGGADSGLSTLAAHDGARGLRVWDTNGNTAAGTAAAYFVALQSGAGDRYLRSWVRLNSASTNGDVTVAQTAHGAPFFSLCMIYLDFPGSEPCVTGDDTPGMLGRSGVTLPANTWHLLECGLLDAGTAAVSRVLWVDGVERARQSNLNHTGGGRVLNEVDLGATYQYDGRFTGIIDLDDVAVTATPPPARLRIDAGPGPLIAGACSPVEIDVVSSIGPFASLLKRQVISVSVAGGSGTVYGDPACASAAALALDAGADRGWAGVIATAGPIVLSASSSDLLSDLGPAIAVLLPDGGTAGSDGGTTTSDGGVIILPDGGILLPDGGVLLPDGGIVERMGVGCDCPTGPGAALLLALCIALVPRPRRARAGREH